MTELLRETTTISCGPEVDEAAERVECINDTIRRATDRATDAGVDARAVELGEWLCPDRPCRTEIDGQTIRPDRVHVEGPGGTPVVRWLLEELA